MVTFRVRLIALSIPFMRVVTCLKFLFFSWLSNISLSGSHHFLMIYSSSDGHGHCFYLVALLNGGVESF